MRRKHRYIPSEGKLKRGELKERDPRQLNVTVPGDLFERLDEKRGNRSWVKFLEELCSTGHTS